VGAPNNIQVNCSLFKDLKCFETPGPTSDRLIGEKQPGHSRPGLQLSVMSPACSKTGQKQPPEVSTVLVKHVLQL